MKPDHIKPDYRDASNRKFYTSRGFLTRYALACGYVDRRGNDESGVRLEQLSSNGALRVCGTGRWLRNDIYTGTSLTEARRAFMSFDHISASANEERAIRNATS